MCCGGQYPGELDLEEVLLALELLSLLIGHVIVRPHLGLHSGELRLRIVPFGTTSQISAPPPPPRETGSRTMAEKHTCSWPTSVISDSVGTAGPAFSLYTMQISRFRRRFATPPQSSLDHAHAGAVHAKSQKGEFRDKGGDRPTCQGCGRGHPQHGLRGTPARGKGTRRQSKGPRVADPASHGVYFYESKHKGVWGSRPSPNPPLHGRPS